MKPFILLVGLVAAIVLLPLLALLFRRKPAQPPRPAGTAVNTVQRTPKAPTIVSDRPFVGAIPQDFPVDAFLRNAKDTFVQLQAAKDRADLNAIRKYATGEVYDDMVRQMRDRGDAKQRTEVLALQADLLEVVEAKDSAAASVRIRGQLRADGGTEEHFDQIWLVQKNLSDDRGAWLLAGIRQTT